MKKTNKIKPKILTKVILIITIGLFISIILFFLLFRVNRISGESMSPTYEEDDICISFRYPKLDRFDVVMINFNDKTYIKRIIGLPNDTIEYRNNVLYINNDEVIDNYNNGYTEDFIITLREDEIFCIGDNREKSMDSILLGPFKTGYVLGEVIN